MDFTTEHGVEAVIIGRSWLPAWPADPAKLVYILAGTAPTTIAGQDQH